MPWYIFALIAPFFYSICNYFDKYIVDKKIQNPINLTVFSSFITGLLGIIIWIFQGFPVMSPIQILFSLFSGLLLILYILFYLKALNLDDASRVIPIFQTIPVFVLIFSYFLLKETLTIKQIFGLGIVLISSASIMMNKLDKGFFKPRKALWYMLFSSGLFALVTVLFKFVVKENNFWTTYTYQCIGTGIGGLLLLRFKVNNKVFFHDLKIFKSIIGIVLINNIVHIIALLSEMYAITLVSVSFVSILSGVQPLFVLIIGIILSLWFPKIIKEDIKKSTISKKIFAVILIFIGFYFVYF
ncbi:MAG: EamA family transporter [bacterium]|nr:EamA family transporter [bacterium]